MVILSHLIQALSCLKVRDINRFVGLFELMYFSCSSMYCTVSHIIKLYIWLIIEDQVKNTYSCFVHGTLELMVFIVVQGVVVVSKANL